MMESTTRLELTYRVRARQVQSSEDYFTNVQQQLETLDWDFERVVGDTLYWPIRPEQVQEAKDAGLLVMNAEYPDCHLILREIRFVFEVPAGGGPTVLDEILEKAGNVFTNIRIVEEFKTEMAPV